MLEPSNPFSSNPSENLESGSALVKQIVEGDSIPIDIAIYAYLVSKI